MLVYKRNKELVNSLRLTLLVQFKVDYVIFRTTKHFTFARAAPRSVGYVFIVDKIRTR